MKKLSFVFITVLAVAIILVGVEATAQVKQGKSRVLQTKNWMAGVNLPHCSELGKILKEGPSDEKQWTEAARHAQVLNESGHVLMADGRCPDKVWADASTQLRDGSAAVLKALEAKNASEAQSAFNGQVLKACESCHAAHKK